ncbi:MAG TPA: PIN domain-containing protein [Longimicrobium sp.]|nr:PIN domain-containing protein [Longimicrobium sp.]
MPADDLLVVIDTNILFSALPAEESRVSRIVKRSPHRLFIGETAFVELFEHKERIARFSRLRPDVLAQALHSLLRKLNLFKEDLIAEGHWAKARELCKDIDPDDERFVALAFALDGVLWTGDKRLQRGLKAKGFYRFFTPDQE